MGIIFYIESQFEIEYARLRALQNHEEDATIFTFLSLPNILFLGSGSFLFWFGTDYVYACGKGVSTFDQAAVAQAKTFALKGVAERIHSNIKASTKVDIKDETKVSRTTVEHIVNKTVVRQQLEDEKYTYKYGGKFHTFMRLKIEKEVFETLINEAKAVQ